MRIDVNAFVGRYPYRNVPGGAPADLLSAMDRVAIDRAWISNLSSLFWRDPTEGNESLYRVADAEGRFSPVPAIHPELANWRDVLQEACDRAVPAVRVAPGSYGIDPSGVAMRELTSGCAEAAMPLVVAVRWEDGRQRHPNDIAGDLSAAAIRTLIRSDDRLRLIVTHADREIVEQVHFGSTPAEAVRILWDICWIWGPPEDHLELLLRTIGLDRFTFGSGMPLRIPENSIAKLDLLRLDPTSQSAIDAENLTRFLTV